jgi:hypothetical protein
VLRATFSFVVLLAFALPASAQEPAPDDEDALAEARAALRDGDAELAIDILEEAREHDDAPALQYELYLAHEQARDHTAAAAHLESYLGRDDVTLDPEERADLEGHLADLHALAAPRPQRDFWADPAVPVVGWALLGAGIAGVLSFPIGAAVAFTLESQLDPICRGNAALCEPGERDGIEEAWIAGSIGLGVGLALGAVGAVFLFLAGQHEDGGSRSLPPDLDPTMQRSFSLAPWVDPVQGGGGVTMSSSF